MTEQETDTPVIYTDQVVRRFGEGAALVTAVGGVSLTVERGEWRRLLDRAVWQANTAQSDRRAGRAG